jgi:hypothetical protein
MKTYNIWYYGLSGEEFEGYLDYSFTEKELDMIRETEPSYLDAFDDDIELREIYDKMLDMIADFALQNWWNLSEIYENYGGNGVTHKAAVLKYLRDKWVKIPFPVELINDLEKEKK